MGSADARETTRIPLDKVDMVVLGGSYVMGGKSGTSGYLSLKG